MNWLKNLICTLFHSSQHMQVELHYNNRGRQQTLECAACGRRWEA